MLLFRTCFHCPRVVTYIFIFFRFLQIIFIHVHNLYLTLCNIYAVSAHRKESQTETSPRSVIWFYLSPLSFAFSSILLLAAAETLFLGECAYCTSVCESGGLCVFVCRTWVWLRVKCLLQERSRCICSHGAQRSAHFGLILNWQLY